MTRLQIDDMARLQIDLMLRADPRATQRRTVARNISLVDERLRSVFRQLVRGAARWPLFLHGPAGTGKTCACLALCDFVRRPCYATAEDAADWIVTPGPNWEWVGNSDLAILDELGTRATVGDLHYQAAKRFCDLRDRKPTVFVSNCAPEQIGQLYDDRVASRVLCGTWHELAGADRRTA